MYRSNCKSELIELRGGMYWTEYKRFVLCVNFRLAVTYVYRYNGWIIKQVL